MADRSKTAFTCLHCGELFTSLAKDICKSCNTPEKRKAMDEENTKIFAAKNLKFHCAYCEREALKGGVK